MHVSPDIKLAFVGPISYIPCVEAHAKKRSSDVRNPRTAPYQSLHCPSSLQMHTCIT